MRGYFGIGVEHISKPSNAGTIFRTAHAFGASFVFTVAGSYSEREGAITDTSHAAGQMPFYAFPSLETMILPSGCELVGVELDEEAFELPTFHHPQRAAYILGPERGGLSDAVRARCRYLVRIPTQFSLNVSIAAAIVMYDRVLTVGRFGERALLPGAPGTPPPEHVFGNPRFRREVEIYQATPPSHVHPRDLKRAKRLENLARQRPRKKNADDPPTPPPAREPAADG